MARKRIRIDMEDSDGAKYDIKLEGNVTRDKVLKIFEMMDLMNIEEGPEALNLDSIGSKIWHIIDKQFPLIRLNNYLPPGFTVDDYLEKTTGLNIEAGALVAGSFQGFEKDYMLSALKQLGSSFVGTIQIPATETDENILELNNAGIRGVRFNIAAGGSEKLDNLEKLALRVHELCGWHVELHIKSSDIKDMYNLLIGLPSVSIDHLGYTKSGFDTLLGLVENGVKVKASGFGRVEFDVKTALIEINSINQNALMFGTDLPSTRAPRPFQKSDIEIIFENFDEEICRNIFYENAAEFYKIKKR